MASLSGACACRRSPKARRDGDRRGTAPACCGYTDLITSRPKQGHRRSAVAGLQDFSDVVDQVEEQGEGGHATVRGDVHGHRGGPTSRSGGPPRPRSVNVKTNRVIASFVTRSRNTNAMIRGVSCALASCRAISSADETNTTNVNIDDARVISTVRAASGSRRQLPPEGRVDGMDDAGHDHRGDNADARPDPQASRYVTPEPMSLDPCHRVTRKSSANEGDRLDGFAEEFRTTAHVPAAMTPVLVGGDHPHGRRAPRRRDAAAPAFVRRRIDRDPQPAERPADPLADHGRMVAGARGEYERVQPAEGGGQRPDLPDRPVDEIVDRLGGAAGFRSRAARARRC